MVPLEKQVEEEDVSNQAEAWAAVVETVHTVEVRQSPTEEEEEETVLEVLPNEAEASSSKLVAPVSFAPASVAKAEAFQVAEVDGIDA